MAANEQFPNCRAEGPTCRAADAPAIHVRVGNAIRTLAYRLHSAARHTWGSEPPGEAVHPDRGWRSLIRRWRSRKQEQLELLYLLEEAPPHILKDVGLTQDQIQDQIDRLRTRHFW